MVPTWPCQRTDWVHALFGTVKNRAAFEKDFLLVRLTGQVAIQGLHNAKRGRTTCHPSRSRYSRISGSHLRSSTILGSVHAEFDISERCFTNALFFRVVGNEGWPSWLEANNTKYTTVLIINFIYAYVLNFP